ncbi:MAG: hypothetical protein LBO09_01980 [Candidatus Peribacteria bacterium]|nr:hypothetical protein [Candidatus Peribacteria bacterium]
MKTITALIEGVPVFTKSVVNSKEELASTLLDLSSVAPGTHDLTLQAITTAGSMNSATISITVQSTDTEAPYFSKDQSKITRTEEEKKVTLIFNDSLSSVVGGTVSVNGEKILDFPSRVATFTTTADTVEVTAKDAYGNVLKETIDLASL